MDTVLAFRGFEHSSVSTQIVWGGGGGWLFLYFVVMFQVKMTNLTRWGSWIRTSCTSYLGLIGLASLILILAVLSSNVSSFKLSSTLFFLLIMLAFREESVKVMVSLMARYGEFPGWIALLRLQNEQSTANMYWEYCCQKIICTPSKCYGWL